MRTKLIQNVVFAFFVGLISLTWNNAFATTKHALFSCDGIDVNIWIKPSSAIIGSVTTYPGTWVEVPTTDATQLKLFNIDSGYLAIMGTSLDGLPFLQIYRDLSAYHQRMPEHSLRCRKN